MPRNNDPQEDTHHELERKQIAFVEMRRAMQRLVGSYALGGLSVWKLFKWEPPEGDGFPWLLVVWIALALLSFGLASWDQIVKAAKR